MQTIRKLLNTLPQQGLVEWIGVRPKRLGDLVSVGEVTADAAAGLAGDHYSKRSGKRQITLIQAEHLHAVASMIGANSIEPALVRRNIAVRGINLLALKDKQFRVGEAVLEYTGLCHPCARMEDLLGPGGYNAMRGHGGITARIITGGQITIGSLVSFTGAGQS